MLVLLELKDVNMGVCLWSALNIEKIYYHQVPYISKQVDKFISVGSISHRLKLA